ncbi:MAG: iron-sulfur cluster biosynthesis family protein, partial [Pseudomonadota bacterium]
MAITLTESAAGRVRDFLARRGKGEGLRLGIRTSGCSGKAYVIEYADRIEPDD